MLVLFGQEVAKLYTPQGGRPPMSSAELSRRLGVSERFVRKLVATRQIPYLKIGRLVRFEEQDVDDYLKSRRVTPTGKPSVTA